MKREQLTGDRAPDNGMHQAEEDPRSVFYDNYRREAGEYDKEFIERHKEDLDTTLIFAGLFSAVASTFITQTQPQLQSDSGDDTVALLRVLIYKIDNTTFGDQVPSLPQWSGPSRAIVHVQCLLYASLAASLLAVFLATLGKQWINRYASTDLRGSAIERSQNRQQKLNGVVAWYFNHVVGSLPLMLQVALLLLACALSRYLWEVNTTVASVVVGVTSFGVLSYIFFTVAGAASDNCPYRTPPAIIVQFIFGPLWAVVLYFRFFVREELEGEQGSSVVSIIKLVFFHSTVFIVAVATYFAIVLAEIVFFHSLSSTGRTIQWLQGCSARPSARG